MKPPWLYFHMAWCYPLCVVLQNEIKKFCYILARASQRLTALTGFRFSIRLLNVSSVNKVTEGNKLSSVRKLSVFHLDNYNV